MAKAEVQFNSITVRPDVLSNLLGSTLDDAGVVDALAALCLTLKLDPTLWLRSATSMGRVLTSMGRQAGLREAALGCGAIQITTVTDGFTAVPAVPICIEPEVPAEMEQALVWAGVEPDVVSSLFFDEVHGQTFRQRITSKWKTFTQLVSRGLVSNPTGFFVAAVRRNWHLSSSYEPGKVKPKVTLLVPVARVEASELDALERIRELDATLEVSPAEQWLAHGATLRLALNWGSEATARLESACTSGRLSAAGLSRESAAARASSTLDRWRAEMLTRV